MEGKLAELVSRLKEAAGKNLESVVLYGSAVRGDFHPGSSDLNVMCTLVSMDLAELQLLSPVIQWWTQRNERARAAVFPHRRVAAIHRCLRH